MEADIISGKNAQMLLSLELHGTYAMLIFLFYSSIWRYCSLHRIYQYITDEFWFNFFNLPSFQTAWIQMNMETMGSCQLTASLCLLCKLVIWKKIVKNQNFNWKVSVWYWYKHQPLQMWLSCMKTIHNLFTWVCNFHNIIQTLSKLNQNKTDQWAYFRCKTR